MCPDGWISFDHSCYKYDSNTDITTANQGAEHCSKEYNGHLAVLNSEEEAIFLGSYLKDLSVS